MMLRFLKNVPAQFAISRPEAAGSRMGFDWELIR